jgi:hypothetical protein
LKKQAGTFTAEEPRATQTEHYGAAQKDEKDFSSQMNKDHEFFNVASHQAYHNL